jgi:MFS family permease
MAAPGQAKEVAYAYLAWGMFIFAFANGTLEAVANPLVATLFPRNRTHYLNILHASWPLGMIAGAVIGWTLDEGMKMSWKIQLAFYLVPTVIYGLMFLGQSFPKSEASAKGIRLADMFKDVGLLGGAVICYLFVLFFNQSLGLPQGAAYAIGGVLLLAIGLITRFSFGSILLFVLFVTHAMVGAVELGTDQWIQNITGNILEPRTGQGALHLDLAGHVCAPLLRALHRDPSEDLARWHSGDLLRPRRHRPEPHRDGEQLHHGDARAHDLRRRQDVLLATMLAVASDRFPRTGAIAISIMGGIGMMSAGLLGSAGLGYAKDRFAGEELKKADPALYEQYKAENTSKFTVFEPVVGLDGKKLEDAQKS